MYQMNRIEGTILSNKERAILLGLTLLIFIIHVRHLGSLGIITVLDDEFGYWGNAAYLAGLDWSGIVSKIPYYSYGYSLLLVPLFFIFDRPDYIYKSAIVLNGVMLSASFLLCFDIALKLAKGFDKKMLMGTAFLIFMYPAYIAYSNIAYTECLLIFIIWLLSWCFTDLSNKSRNFKFVLIGFLTMYLYMVHQRALGVLIASICVIIVMNVLGRINLRKVLLVFLPMIILFLVHVYLKDYIQTQLWLNNSGNLTNDYLAQASKISQIFQGDGFIALIKASLGHVFYIGAASYLLGYFGIYELLTKIVKAVVATVRNRKLEILSCDHYFPLYAFLLIAVLFSLAINIIFMINPFRMDQIVYGRYIDMIMGPLILLGFISLINNESNQNRVFWMISIGFIPLTIAVKLIIDVSGLTFFSILDAVGLLLITYPFSVFLPAITAILACRLMLISFVKKDSRLIIISFIMVSLCFFVTGDNVARTTAVGNQTTTELIDAVKYIENGMMPVYFLWDDQEKSIYRKIADCYQFLLKDIPVKLVNKTELEAIDEKAFVLTPFNYKYLSDVNRDYEYCMDNQYTYLFVSKTSGLCE